MGYLLFYKLARMPTFLATCICKRIKQVRKGVEWYLLLKVFGCCAYCRQNHNLKWSYRCPPFRLLIPSLLLHSHRLYLVQTRCERTFLLYSCSLCFCISLLFLSWAPRAAPWAPTLCLIKSSRKWNEAPHASQVHSLRFVSVMGLSSALSNLRGMTLSYLSILLTC